MPALFDTHAHLDEPGLLSDLDALLTAAREHGLQGILTIGTTVSSSLKSIELAKQDPILHAAVGIHPNYVSKAVAGDWEQIVKLAQYPEVCAIGETGLDRYWDDSPFDLQVDYFQRHLELSRETGKPFIVHCRDAEPDVLTVLEEASKQGPLNGVMHSFCGSLDAAQKCVEWGMMISFSGMLTFKRNEELREIAAQIPRDRLLVETDSPYLAPMPYRGKRNQPAYVKYTAEVLAANCHMPQHQMAELTYTNARRFLRLS
ncbi:MAG: TatD family hydrolase [Planctomycetaceae bacterium]|nr:TatD family hydrolase [Planctomycetaceae bacterium]